jgi:peptidoglycan/LPS O-acetylase OafA/YrhL
MIDPTAGANARLSAFSGDQELLAEIPAGIADLLHDRARERYLRRVWQTVGLVALVAVVVLIAPSPGLTPTEQLAGAIAVLIFLGYLAYGFTWAWPERWEHQLLLEEIDYRRQHGKWRWEL